MGETRQREGPCGAAYPHQFTVDGLTPEWRCWRLAGHDGYHEAPVGPDSYIAWLAGTPPGGRTP